MDMCFDRINNLLTLDTIFRHCVGVTCKWCWSHPTYMYYWPLQSHSQTPYSAWEWG